jgi:superfamily I DNA/RNA helicase
MVPLGTTILQATAVARNAVRNTYSHVFLDEFQDCTTQQYALLRTAFRPKSAVFTAVGDAKQRIMGWAGALDGIFGEFVAGYDAKPLYLYQNFRSAPRVRRVQNAMVKVMDPGAAVPDDDLLGSDGEVAAESYATSSDEARRVADSVEGWINDEGVPPSEIAVLVRQQTSLYAHELMEELSSRGIAFRNEQEVQDAFAEPLGQLIIDFLSVTIHVRQPDAYARLMSVVAPRSDDEEYDQVNAARWRRRIERSRSILRDPDGGGQHMISEVEHFLADIGLDRLVALSPSYADRGRFDQLRGSVLEGLAAMVELGGGRLEAMTQVNDDGAVRILTIHKAKGLEFHSVVVLGVEEQTFWSADTLANRSEFFVAISRAKKRLVLTVAARRRKPPGAGRWDEVRSPQREFLSYATG